MKRKVFSNGPSLVITLPSSWVSKYDITSGKEIDVQEEGNELKLFLDSGKKLESIKIDADGFDKTFLKCAIRNAYKRGYDEILVKFSNSEIKHHRLSEVVHVNDAVKQEIGSLVGFEIVDQTSDSIKLSGFLNENKDDFDNFLRKTFLNLNQYVKDLEKIESSEVWEQKHWDIKKFITYCIRIINKKGLSSNSSTYLSLIIGLDIILGVLHHTGRYVLNEKLKYSDETLSVLKDMSYMFEEYYNLFYKYSKERVVEFGIHRWKIRDRLNSVDISSKELILLERVYQTVEVLYRLVETRMELE